MSEKILAAHLERRATVYLRQSTLKQVHEHRESTARQYALRQRAVDLGWQLERIDVIDDDLGQSGSSAAWREGFQRLAADVAHGRVGAIFALEVSRLARSSADWHRLLELCGLADVVIADEQSVYTPRDYNDRLLLGLKGTMSEAEQYWMRLRLEGGRLSKARRGELFFCPPAGYEWDRTISRFRFDPDEQVQRAIRLVFERFRLDGSAYAVMRYFARHGLDMPVRNPSNRALRWVPAKHTLMLGILHNPIYAGAYVFGRSEERMGLVDGELRRRYKKRLPQDAWRACLQDHHPAYIGWDEFMANQRKLHENRTNIKVPDQRGAAREGHALLQGLALCGRCGHRMSVHYCGERRRAVYQCRSNSGEGACWSVPARVIDQAVAELFLQAVKPPEIELGLAVLRETEEQAGEVARQWELRLDRARYEAQLAERRYKAVDPDNRVVARTLESEWNDKLTEVVRLEREHGQVREREKLDLSPADRARILALARDLSAVWNAETTTHAERKNLLRMLVREVSLTPIEVPRRETRVQVLWQTGAVSDFMVPRQGKYLAVSTPAQALALVRELFACRKTDVEIAAELNRRGLQTGAKLAWTVGAVRAVRYDHDMYRPSPKSRHAPGQRADGLCSVHGVALQLGVRPSLVRQWARTGVLQPAVVGGPGRPHWFRIDPGTLERLLEAKRRHWRERSGDDVLPSLLEEGHCE
jgi:DNA invertase Pin-like site-specific DNA recombinase